jgi:hypothetical protein
MPVLLCCGTVSMVNPTPYVQCGALMPARESPILQASDSYASSCSGYYYGILKQGSTVQQRSVE